MAKCAADGQLNILAYYLSNHGNHYLGLYQNVAEPAEDVVLPKSAWQAEHVYSLNDIVRPTTPNGLCYICTTAGTSGVGEPEWPVVKEETEEDGTAVWTCYKDCITEPAGLGGYARIALAKNTWVVSADPATYPQQTFECAEASPGWGDIYGYFIATSVDDTGIVVWVETFSGGPYDIQDVGWQLKITATVKGYPLGEEVA